ncbi:MAG: DUF4743 domain-containing protein [SAR324 cluster bacterium]|nr:DUF4743 domain-containing protein [SAR324 cluster bacterium]
MSYLYWIHTCNNFDRTRFIPFKAGTHHVGWVRESFLPDLRHFPGIFRVQKDEVRIHSTIQTFEDRTAAMQEVLKYLQQKDLLPALYHELYPACALDSDQPPLFLLERAVVPLFGIRAFGIHLNGIVHKQGRCYMWIARREMTRSSYPGLLDNLVGGGKSHELTLWETMLKEAAEEAGIPHDLASQARGVSAINYCMETKNGLRQDVIVNYDLELPKSFQPYNQDGEVSEFYLWSLDQVQEMVISTKEFKTNCNLVIIDFLIRHGYISPDNPEYLALNQGLHPSFPQT